jgi:glucokinase
MPADDTAIPFPVLIGDIGGTNARFAILPAANAPAIGLPPVATSDFPDIESAIGSCVYASTDIRPATLMVDLAGPITGDAVRLTNADWVIRPSETMRRTGAESVILLNDFEALALALTALADADVAPLGGGTAERAGAKVVLGPGTGLGVGALIEANGVFIPVPGEGGHVSLGPAEADELLLWPNIEPEFGRISAEALLCGRGLVRLYRAVAATAGLEAALSGPAAVTEAALLGADAVAVKTLDLYCRLLGRLAGDLALTFMAKGGVYVGGGISPRILPFLEGGSFRRAFEAKAPHEALMRAMPSYVITRENPALVGLAALAYRPDLYGVNLEGRRWRR